MSQRPPQPPAVIAVQSGVTNSTLTPRRLPISLAVSMSKPWYVPSAFSSDCGGYFGSVETTSLPALMILSSRPPGTGLAGAADADADADATAVRPVVRSAVRRLTADDHAQPRGGSAARGFELEDVSTWRPRRARIDALRAVEMGKRDGLGRHGDGFEGEVRDDWPGHSRGNE